MSGAFCSVSPWIVAALVVGSGFVSYRYRLRYGVLLASLAVAAWALSSYAGCGFVGEFVFWPSLSP